MAPTPPPPPPVEYKYVIVDCNNHNPMKEVEGLLDNGWHPVREVGLPSAAGGKSFAKFGPCGLILLKRLKNA